MIVMPAPPATPCAHALAASDSMHRTHSVAHSSGGDVPPQQPAVSLALTSQTTCQLIRKCRAPGRQKGRRGRPRRPGCARAHRVPETPRSARFCQKPTSDLSQDVGLNIDDVVGPPSSHSNLWEACWRYVMQHASEQVPPPPRTQRPRQVPQREAAPTSTAYSRGGDVGVMVWCWLPFTSSIAK